MKPVIYFVHYSVAPGGIEVLLPEIINNLKDWQVKVFVIRPPKTNQLSVYKNFPVEIHYGSDSNLIALTKLFGLALKNKKAIFHLFNAGPFFLLALRISGIKRIIYSIHGTNYWSNAFQKFFRKLFWNLANSKKIIFTSNTDYSAKVFKEKIWKEVGIRKIYNPIDHNRFNSLERGSDTGNELKIMYAGRLTEGKNLFSWIDTAEFLLDNGVKSIFNIYGDGELYGDLEKRIKASKHREQIKLKGHTNRLEEAYKNSDLLLFLSEYESFGNVAVESVLCGTPIIALNIPAMKEIFHDFPVFLIDKELNVRTSVLEKIKEMDKLRSAASVAMSAFQTRFGTKMHIDQLHEIYSGFE